MKNHQTPVISQAMETPQFGWLCAKDKEGYPVSTRGYLFDYESGSETLKVIVSKTDSAQSVLPLLSKDDILAAVVSNGMTFNS